MNKSPAERHRAMTWMQNASSESSTIDIEVCEHCGGHVKVIGQHRRSEGH
ncbi:hypothetical protein [Escherichia coli]